MRAKKFFITAFLLLLNPSLFPQCISIELSVIWEMKKDIFNEDSVVNTPFLNIIYRSNCDTNYYFFKVSPRKDGQSMVFYPGLLQYQDGDYIERAKQYGNYRNLDFNVIMGKEPWGNAGWQIYRDTADFHKGYISKESINLCLETIYTYLYAENITTEYSQLHSAFETSDITPENILGNYQFVFLKPKEAHLDTYNLIGFKLVEGCFTFIIEKEIIEDYVLVHENFASKEVKLPIIVGEYQLYSGSFNTNKVTVCFGER